METITNSRVKSGRVNGDYETGISTEKPTKRGDERRRRFRKKGRMIESKKTNLSEPNEGERSQFN